MRMADKNTTIPIASTIYEVRPLFLIRIFIIVCPMRVATKPIVPKTIAYSYCKSPYVIKEIVAVRLVNKIIVAEVAAATSGCTPIINMSGPFTIPPPTPNIPANNPAVEHMSGYTRVVRESQTISPSIYG